MEIRSKTRKIIRGQQKVSYSVMEAHRPQHQSHLKTQNYRIGTVVAQDNVKAMAISYDRKLNVSQLGLIPSPNPGKLLRPNSNADSVLFPASYAIQIQLS